MEESAGRKLSTDKILGKVAGIFAKKISSDGSPRALDIGSGTGALVQIYRAHNPRVVLSCVDYTDTLIEDKRIKVDVVDLNTSKLPYADNQFDFVSCAEVIEHLENYRQVVREAFRVLKPARVVVFTTPNTLSLKSRMRYLWTGFHNLFGPLDVGRWELFLTGGHITPVGYFYLAHAMAEAGFENIRLDIDKQQTSSYLLLVLMLPLILLFGGLAFAREKRKGFANSTNAHLISQVNTLDMLLGRTIIVTGEKPALQPN